MFRNKKNAVITFLLLLSAGVIFAASKTVNSLSLNFTRQETLLSTGEQNTIKGRVTWWRDPFLFIFQIDYPSAQIMYINSDGAFILDNDTVYDFSDNSEFLMQTCSDFLNWFKEDLGLRESHFTPSLTWLEEGKVVTQWDCHYQEDQPISKILACTDSFGSITELTMYMDDELPVTKTTLSNFEYSAGYRFPTLITSVSFENETAAVKTELGLSQTKFNFPCDSSYSNQTIELAQSTPQDLSTTELVQSPQAPAATAYKVSIPSVLVNASFKFYKKFITNQDMTNCPFYPSCSQYMLEAVSENGIAGFIQGLERLKRCTTTEHSRNLYPTLSNGKHYDPVVKKEKSK